SLRAVPRQANSAPLEARAMHVVSPACLTDELRGKISVTPTASAIEPNAGRTIRPAPVVTGDFASRLPSLTPDILTLAPACLANELRGNIPATATAPAIKSRVGTTNPIQPSQATPAGTTGSASAKRERPSTSDTLEPERSGKQE